MHKRAVVLALVAVSFPALAALSPSMQRVKEMKMLLDDKQVTQLISDSAGSRGATGVADQISVLSEKGGGVEYLVHSGRFQLYVKATYGKLPPGVAGAQPVTLHPDRRLTRATSHFKPSASGLTYAGRSEFLQLVLDNADLESLLQEPAYTGKSTGLITSIAYEKDDGPAVVFTVRSGTCSAGVRVTTKGKNEDGSIQYEAEVPKALDCK